MDIVAAQSIVRMNGTSRVIRIGVDLRLRLIAELDIFKADIHYLRRTLRESKMRDRK